LAEVSPLSEAGHDVALFATVKHPRKTRVYKPYEALGKAQLFATVKRFSEAKSQNVFWQAMPARRVDSLHFTWISILNKVLDFATVDFLRSSFIPRIFYGVFIKY
jgi:hypothetical protein